MTAPANNDAAPLAVGQAVTVTAPYRSGTRATIADVEKRRRGLYTTRTRFDYRLRAQDGADMGWYADDEVERA